MCLAIGPGCEPERGPLGRLWWGCSGSPLRLFIFGGILQAAVTLLMHRLESMIGVFPILAALSVTSLFLLGWLFEALPKWTSRSPVHHARYSLIFVLFNAPMVFLLLPLKRGDGKIVAVTALAFGFLLALSTAHTYLRWVRPSHRRQTLLVAGLSFSVPIVFLILLIAH